MKGEKAPVDVDVVGVCKVAGCGMHVVVCQNQADATKKRNGRSDRLSIDRLIGFFNADLADCVGEGRDYQIITEIRSLASSSLKSKFGNLTVGHLSPLFVLLLCLRHDSSGQQLQPNGIEQNSSCMRRKANFKIFGHNSQITR